MGHTFFCAPFSCSTARAIMDLKTFTSPNGKKRPIFISLLTLFTLLLSIAFLVFGILLFFSIVTFPVNKWVALFAGMILSFGFFLLSKGFFTLQNWARTCLLSILIVILIGILILQIFDFSSAVFAGKEVLSLGEIFSNFGKFLLKTILHATAPGIIFFFLYKSDDVFSETPKQRHDFDRIIRNFLMGTALSAILIVILIFFFTFQESELAITEIGLKKLLTGTIWRPGAIIGTENAQFGLVPMVIGSIYSTLGAILIGLPLSLGTAILLAEIAPDFVRNIFRTSIELLSGIPSVVYGLFGMVVVAPMIRQIPVEGNTTGFGILNASIILSIMILPTITNITEDAIRAVPNSYREASYALGATHWQTIKDVVLPAANSGILAAVILGISRALGETMALIMVIGNSIAIPKPINENPLSVIFATARTLTGNIAVEINYAAGVHRSALFFTGVLLFVFLLLINRLANRIMRGNKTK